ncbi:1949_t:CDS:1 [Acaulospora morrowiae]|uniref:1949_t:CDS:1 n=1 Tax=Acaulospora morrowiae TaxID=94023 RepID=A0A9N9A4U1_9GLOM|nr:1949_t:CDS:1 [Acaulospora morrowiae]
MSACPDAEQIFTSFPQLKNILSKVSSRCNSDSPKDYVNISKNRSGKRSKVRRPMNSFMIFKNMYRKELIRDSLYEDICKKFKIERNRKAHLIPKIAAKLWGDLKKRGRGRGQAPFIEFARKVKNEHEKAFPGYKYKPKRKNKEYGFRQFIPEEKLTKHKRDEADQTSDAGEAEDEEHEDNQESEVYQTS